MTDLENKILELTKDTWNSFIELPIIDPNIHKDDTDDFRHHLHALQNIILSREGLRSLQK